MRGQPVLWSRASDEWSTPRDFYQVVAREYACELDAAATAENATCARHYTATDNGLLSPWATWTWCNPPYSQIDAFADKALAEQARGHGSVLLVPARTDTRWFHRLAPRATEVRLIKGRLRFGGGQQSAPFPSALIVLAPGGTGHPRIVLWDWRAAAADAHGDQHDADPSHRDEDHHA